MGLVRLEAPAALHTLAELQLHLRVDNAEEDDRLLALGAAAVEAAEAFTRRRFVSQKWRLLLDAWPDRAITVPYAPLLSVESVKYVDAAGTLQTLATTQYAVRTTETPGEIVRAYDVSWPDVRTWVDVVRVEFTAGYGAAAAVPAAIRQAVLLIVGGLYDNPANVVAGISASEIPATARALLGPYCVRRW